MKYSPLFWITHSNRSIHARKIFCRASNVTSLHNSLTASKILSGFAAAYPPSGVITFQRARSHTGSGLVNRPGARPGQHVLCLKRLPLSCHCGILNCPCAANSTMIFRRAHWDLSGCNSGITFLTKASWLCFCPFGRASSSKSLRDATNIIRIVFR
jgi:hypothetical protein